MLHDGDIIVEKRRVAFTNVSIYLTTEEAKKVHSADLSAPKLEWLLELKKAKHVVDIDRFIAARTEGLDSSE